MSSEEVSKLTPGSYDVTYKGCNVPLLPVELPVVDTHQSLLNTVATLGKLAPVQLEFWRNLSLGGVL